jgi:glycosyltransferase involved in cell wall biosynthesis
MRICRVTTVPFVLHHHLRSQIQATVAAGHEVHLVSSQTSGFSGQSGDECPIDGTQFYGIPIARQISPGADLRAMVALYRYFLRNRCEVVHSVTSKAGLLCAVAGFAARVPLRLHTFIGQPWAGLRGPVRSISKACDWLIVRLNTQCYADSASQRDYLVAEKVARKGDIKTLGAGSIAGVDLARFLPGRFQKAQIKAELNIPIDAPVIVFTGRLGREKGIVELLAAFDLLSRDRQSSPYLLLIGPSESGAQAVPGASSQDLANHPTIRSVGYTATPERYFSVADVLCLPSYREGFGSVVIEAAAMGVPAVVTRVVGLMDAVVGDETGLFVPPRDVVALANALVRIIDDDALRQRLGEAARARANRQFDSAMVNDLVIKEYEILRHAVR